MAWADHGKRPGPKPKDRLTLACSFDECDRVAKSLGLCHSHYLQQRRGNPLRPIRPPKPKGGPGLSWCGACTQFRDDSEFGWDTVRDQIKRTCRPCAAVRQTEYVSRNRERVNLLRRIRERGISLDEYEALQSEQGGACAICGRTDRPLDIDHCHATGKVRGLLCGPCNRALGFAGDDPEVLRAAIRYLESHA